MSRLFINLFLDDDVSVLIAKLLQSRAYAALTTLEAGQAGKSDVQQLAFASERKLALLTRNRADFEKLAAEYISAGANHCGIIIAVRRSPYEITRRLLLLLDQITAEEMDNQVVYI